MNKCRFKGRIKTSINFEQQFCTPGVGTLRRTLAATPLHMGDELIISFQIVYD